MLGQTITAHRLQGVYQHRGKLCTQNLAPGKQVYGEDLIRSGGKEYRLWDPAKSKLCAAIMKGLSQIGVKPGSLVLYLGASTGTTVSHVSDIAGPQGFVFALDSAPRMVRELVLMAEQRPNIAPLLADAHLPEQYAPFVFACDMVYQDVAQRDQVPIFLKNVKRYLKKGGFALLCVKARSIDVSKAPNQIYQDVWKQLEGQLTIVDSKKLDPFQKDHMLFVCKRK